MTPPRPNKGRLLAQMRIQIESRTNLQPRKNSKKKLLKENPEIEELDREKHKQTQRHQVWGNDKLKLF